MPLKIKIVEECENGWDLQEASHWVVRDFEIWRKKLKQYTKEQLWSLLQTLESEAQPYIELFDKQNNNDD